MKTKVLLFNGHIHTMANRQVVDSMVVHRNRIMAVGNHLEYDPDFQTYSRINLRGRTVMPGFVDAHTHFAYYAQSLGEVDLDGVDSLDKCLRKIRAYANKLPARAWVKGNGYSPDRFRARVEPDRYMLDKVTGDRPAFVFSKDQHSAWVNSRALELAGINEWKSDPDGGQVVRSTDGSPTGVLREGPAYHPVFRRIPLPGKGEQQRNYDRALQIAYRLGITGVHSFDGPEAFALFAELAEKGKTGVRINYYPSAQMLEYLEKTGTVYGTGTEFFRIAGVKIFADGALGSQTALCFNKYIGSKDNFGIETTPVPKMKTMIRRAAKLGLPCAIHAIGDRAVANVLDALQACPPIRSGARHRIEHLQLVRRKDLARVKALRVVASMQPSHCPSDISMVRKYWGRRSANAYVFRSMIDKGIGLAFGSDAPIEPLGPLAGIAAAVRRALPGKRDVFHPEQRLTAHEALDAFTVGAAVATGEEHCRGYLMPGYPADFVVLDTDITRIAPSRILDTSVLATVIDGTIKYGARSLQ